MFRLLISTPDGSYWRYSSSPLELGTLVKRWSGALHHHVGIVTMREPLSIAEAWREMNVIVPDDCIDYEVDSKQHPAGTVAQYSLRDGTQYFTYWPIDDIRCHFVDSLESAIAHLDNIITVRFFSKAEKELEL